MQDTIIKMMVCKQAKDEDLMAYIRQFKAQCDVFKEQVENAFLDDFME